MNEHDPGQPENQPENKQEKWVYQGAPPKKREGLSPLQFIGYGVAAVFYLAIFTILPVVIFIIVDWVVYFVTRDTFYAESWVTPMVLVLATFLSGAYMRQMMEERFKTMGVFVVGVFALVIFSALVYKMLTEPGSIISPRWFPSMPMTDAAIVFCLPFTGVIGMFCFRFFSMRN